MLRKSMQRKRIVVNHPTRILLICPVIHIHLPVCFTTTMATITYISLALGCQAPSQHSMHIVILSSYRNFYRAVHGASKVTQPIQGHRAQATPEACILLPTCPLVSWPQAETSLQSFSMLSSACLMA